MTTTTAAPALAAGVPCTEAWRLVEASDPDLVAAWRAARAAYDREEPGYQDRAAAFQRDRNIPRHRPTSREAKALEAATAAVAEAVEELIESGQVVYAGYPSGQLGGAPQIIPSKLLCGRWPQSPRVTVEGTVFYRVRLYRAADLASAESALS